MDDKLRCFGEAFRTLRPGGRLVVCAWLANSTPHPWQVRHLLKPICQEGRLPGLGDEAEYVDLLRRTGFAVSSVEDVSAAVARTWSVCVRRAVRKFAADSQVPDASFSTATPAIEYLPSRCFGCCWPIAPARCATSY